MKGDWCKANIAFLVGLLVNCLVIGLHSSSQGSDVTISIDEATFNFIAYGDTRGTGTDSVSPLHSDIVDAYLAPGPEFIIHTGDMVYHGGEWYQWLEFNRSIAAVWDSGTPFYGAVGNHELYTDTWGVNDDDLSNYTTFFDFSDVAEQSNGTELLI